jgi:hypothetical protein
MLVEVDVGDLEASGATALSSDPSSHWNRCSSVGWSLGSAFVNAEHGLGAIVYLICVLEVNGCESSEEVIGKSAECKAFGSIVRAAEWISARVIVGSCNGESILLVSIWIVEHIDKFRNGNIWRVKIAIWLLRLQSGIPLVGDTTLK